MATKRRSGNLFPDVARSSHARRLCGEKWDPYRGFVDRTTSELLFVPESEEAVFQRVRLPYLPPKERI